MPKRTLKYTDFSVLYSGGYRYGYNGMEKDDEAFGEGNSYTTEFRQYDPRLGRWKSLDPLMMEFPWMSPYVAFDNNPVYFIDPYGLKSESGSSEGGSDKGGEKGRDKRTRKPKEIPTEEKSEMPSLEDIDGVGDGVVIKPKPTQLNFWDKLKNVANKVVNAVKATAIFVKSVISTKVNNFVKDLKRFENWILEGIGVAPVSSDGNGESIGTKVENDRKVPYIDIEWINDLDGMTGVWGSYNKPKPGDGVLKNGNKTLENVGESATINEKLDDNLKDLRDDDNGPQIGTTTSEKIQLRIMKHTNYGDTLKGSEEIKSETFESVSEMKNKHSQARKEGGEWWLDVNENK